MSEPKKVWIVYDSRAAGGDTEDATVYVTADSLQEAQGYVRRDFPDGVIYAYDLVNNEAVNEVRVL